MTRIDKDHYQVSEWGRMAAESPNVEISHEVTRLTGASVRSITGQWQC